MRIPRRWTRGAAGGGRHGVLLGWGRRRPRASGALRTVRLCAPKASKISSLPYARLLHAGTARKTAEAATLSVDIRLRRRPVRHRDAHAARPCTSCRRASRSLALHRGITARCASRGEEHQNWLRTSRQPRTPGSAASRSANCRARAQSGDRPRRRRFPARAASRHRDRASAAKLRHQSTLALGPGGLHEVRGGRRHRPAGGVGVAHDRHAQS